MAKRLKSLLMQKRVHFRCSTACTLPRNYTDITKNHKKYIFITMYSKIPKYNIFVNAQNNKQSIKYIFAEINKSHDEVSCSWYVIGSLGFKHLDIQYIQLFIVK